MALFIWWREDNHPYEKLLQNINHVTVDMVKKNDTFIKERKYRYLAEAKPQHLTPSTHHILWQKNYEWSMAMSRHNKRKAAIEFFEIKDKILKAYTNMEENWPSLKSIPKQPHFHFKVNPLFKWPKEAIKFLNEILTERSSQH